MLSMNWICEGCGGRNGRARRRCFGCGASFPVEGWSGDSDNDDDDDDADDDDDDDADDDGEVDSIGGIEDGESATEEGEDTGYRGKMTTERRTVARRLTKIEGTEDEDDGSEMNGGGDGEQNEEEEEEGMTTQPVCAVSSWMCEGCGGRNGRTRRNCDWCREDCPMINRPLRRGGGSEESDESHDDDEVDSIEGGKDGDSATEEGEDTGYSGTERPTVARRLAKKEATEEEDVGGEIEKTAMTGQTHSNSGSDGEHYQEEEGTSMQPVTTKVTGQTSHTIKVEPVEKIHVTSRNHSDHKDDASSETSENVRRRRRAVRRRKKRKAENKPIVQTVRKRKKKGWKDTAGKGLTRVLDSPVSNKAYGDGESPTISEMSESDEEACDEPTSQNIAADNDDCENESPNHSGEEETNDNDVEEPLTKPVVTLTQTGDGSRDHRKKIPPCSYAGETSDGSSEEGTSDAREKSSSSSSAQMDITPPTRPVSPCGLYRLAHSSHHPNMKVADKKKFLSIMYGNLTAEERARWEARARMNKVRYNAPIFPFDAFDFFAIELRPTVMEAHPHGEMEKIVKLIRGLWNGLPSESKRCFTSKYEEDLKRFEREMQLYNTPEDERQSTTSESDKDSKKVMNCNRDENTNNVNTGEHLKSEETLCRINGVDLEEEKEDSDENRDTEDTSMSSSAGATSVQVDSSVDKCQKGVVPRRISRDSSSEKVTTGQGSADTEEEEEEEELNTQWIDNNDRSNNQTSTSSQTDSSVNTNSTEREIEIVRAYKNSKKQQPEGRAEVEKRIDSKLGMGNLRSTNRSGLHDHGALEGGDGNETWECDKCSMRNNDRYNKLSNVCSFCDNRRPSVRLPKEGDVDVKRNGWTRNTTTLADAPCLYEQDILTPDLAALRDRLSSEIFEFIESKQPPTMFEPLTEMSNGYYKAHLKDSFVKDKLMNVLPLNLTVKENASQKGILFVSLDEVTCPTHFDRDTSGLVLLAGTKDVYLAKNRRTNLDETTISNSTIFNSIHPFCDVKGELDWQKCTMTPGDTLLIPKDWIHSIKSSAMTIALSLQVDASHRTGDTPPANVTNDWDSTVDLTRDSGDDDLATAIILNKRSDRTYGQHEDEEQCNVDMVMDVLPNASRQEVVTSLSKSGNDVNAAITLVLSQNSADVPTTTPLSKDDTQSDTGTKHSLIRTKREEDSTSMDEQTLHTDASNAMNVPLPWHSKLKERNRKHSVGVKRELLPSDWLHDNESRKHKSSKKCPSRHLLLECGKNRRTSTREIPTCGMPECSNSFNSGEMWLLLLDVKTYDVSKKLPIIVLDFPNHLICKSCFIKSGLNIENPYSENKEFPEAKKYHYELASAIDYYTKKESPYTLCKLES